MLDRVLPKGWEWKKLEETADINMGQSPSGTSYNENGVGTPFLQGNAEFGDTFPKHKKFTTEPSKIALKGSVLISVRAPVGDTNIADLNYSIGRGLAAISLKNGDNKYLLYLLRSMKPRIEAKGTGSTFKAISKSIINEIKIPLPPLPVQHQIVAVLQQAEAVKCQRKEADALMGGVLLQSVFYDMFGNPARNEKGWEIIKFGDCCKTIRYGTGIPPEYINDGIPFIRATNVKNGTIAEKNLKFVSVEDAKKNEKSRIYEGNLIIVRSGVNTGDCAYVPKKYSESLAGFDLIVEFDSEISAQFFNFLINSTYGKRKINLLKRRAAQEHLNSEQLSSIEVPLPPFVLQQQFARFVEEMERVRERQEESNKEIEGLCEGLMQRVFAGELMT